MTVAKKQAKKAAKKAKKIAKKAGRPIAKKAVKKIAPKKAAKKSPVVKAAKKVVKKEMVKAAVKTGAKKKAAKKVAKKAAPIAVEPVPVTPAVSIPPGSVPEAPKPAVKLVAVGERAPAFSLLSSTGSLVSLSDYAGRTVVLYFYPKADTPGCTVQACAFRDSIADYGQAGLDIVGISPDPVDAVTEFAKKFNVNFPLLADSDHSVCEKYGVWVEKSMYGKTYMGAARTTFIVKDGVVSRVFEKVNPEGHEKEILAAVEGPH